MTIYIFTGPTLSSEAGRAELEAVFLPPVAQGDVARLAGCTPSAIGIIDGYFDQAAPVWHKEILWAMAEGIHVYGSASMGALRAAELASFGMKGVGKVFESFLDGTLEDDDEVAIVHGPEELGYPCLSEAMVNIRATLAKAESAFVATPATCKCLIAIAKGLFYQERSYDLLLRRGTRSGLPTDELDALRRWLPKGAVNLKRQDALAMLRVMSRRFSDETSPKQVTYRMEHTDFFWNYVMWPLANTPELESDNGTTVLSDAAVLEELRLEGPSYLQTRDQGLLRELALAEAQRYGYQVGDEASESHSRKLQERLGIEHGDQFRKWLQQNHMTPERFHALAREEMLLTKLLSARDASRRVLDHLRLTGRFPELRERAIDKRRRLRSAGLDGVILEDASVTCDELVDWYVRRLGLTTRTNPGEDVCTFGFESVDDLIRALLREYCYLRLVGKIQPG